MQRSILLLHVASGQTHQSVLPYETGPHNGTRQEQHQGEGIPSTLHDTHIHWETRNDNNADRFGIVPSSSALPLVVVLVVVVNTNACLSLPLRPYLYDLFETIQMSLQPDEPTAAMTEAKNAPGEEYEEIREQVCVYVCLFLPKDFCVAVRKANMGEVKRTKRW